MAERKTRTASKASKELSKAEKDKLEKAEKRKKDLAILKAQNEMLQQAMEDVREHEGGNGDKTSVLESIEQAINENYAKGAALGASKEEINAQKYHGPSEKAVKDYERRLKYKGLTDEELHQKDISKAEQEKATVGYGENDDDMSDEDKSFIAGLGVSDSKKEEKVSTAVSEDADDEFLKGVDNMKKAEEKRKEYAKKHVEEVIEHPVPEEVEEAVVEDEKDEEGYEDTEAHIDGIPMNVQYDIIPLPSNGQCYKTKRSRVPVAYLTAADENLITSPMLYNDGKVLDLILKRKVLDKTFDPMKMCRGDRDCILIWLRATGYGKDFPVTVHDPELNRDYDTIVDLSKIKSKPFNLKSGKDGLFEYKLAKGDIIKFHFLTREDEIEIAKKTKVSDASEKKSSIYEVATSLENIVNNDDAINLGMKQKMDASIKYIRAYGDSVESGNEFDNISRQMTDSMLATIDSINGNSDRAFIEDYVDNMRAGDAYRFRQYVLNNEPGMDLRISVKRPDSLGGGTFDTFLDLDNFIFLRIE